MKPPRPMGNNGKRPMCLAENGTVSEKGGIPWYIPKYIPMLIWIYIPIIIYNYMVIFEGNKMEEIKFDPLELGHCRNNKRGCLSFRIEDFCAVDYWILLAYSNSTIFIANDHDINHDFGEPPPWVPNSLDSSPRIILDPS